MQKGDNPMKTFRRFIPNILSILRILLTLLIIYFGFTNHIRLLLFITLISLFIDFLDGRLARKWNNVTKLGAHLDVIADKAFLFGLLLILIARDHEFLYILLLEAVICFVNLFLFFKKGVANSSLLGKIKTWIILITFLIGLLDLILIRKDIPIKLAIYITMIIQLLTLFLYIYQYIDSKKDKKNIINEYEQFLKLISPILTHPEFLKRKEYMHHIGESVYNHTLRVSYDSYKIAKRLGWDYQAAAIGGLLHDFYDKPWQNDSEKKPFFQKHGFVHAEQARVNAWKYFPEKMNLKIEDIIRKHMFPLNKSLPKYRESWLISFVDKADSMDFVMHPRELIHLFFKKEINEVPKTKHKFIKSIKQKVGKE